MNLLKSLLSVILLFCFFLPWRAHAEPMNLYILFSQLRQYYDSGQYELDICNVAKEAEKYIDFRFRKNLHTPLKQRQNLAVVFDIDETLLSSYKSMEQNSFVVTEAQFIRDASSANFTAIYCMRQLYNHVLARNVSIFLITGRDKRLKEATLKNLRKAGFSNWKQLYFFPLKNTYPTAVSYKKAIRRKIWEKGFRIIASIGDQSSDLMGGFSEVGYKLPNPFYLIE